MDKNFWQDKWDSNQIGFHLKETNPVLVKYFEKLSLNSNERIFLPLCGKSLDIAWLLSKGLKVAGAEIVEIAIQQLFKELDITPIITRKNNLNHYSGPNIDIYAGDIFKITPELLGNIDAIYDRAALVALPNEVRIRYTEHLMKITKTARQLLITFEYNQSLTSGPPFSVDGAEVREHYEKAYQIDLLESNEILNGLKGQVAAKEEVWELNKKLG